MATSFDASANAAVGDGTKSASLNAGIGRSLTTTTLADTGRNPVIDTRTS